jgi:hypothetical protein
MSEQPLGNAEPSAPLPLQGLRVLDLGRAHPRARLPVRYPGRKFQSGRPGPLRFGLLQCTQGAAGYSVLLDHGFWTIGPLRAATGFGQRGPGTGLLPPIESAIAKWRQRDLYDVLVARDIVAAPIYTLAQTFNDPQVIHRGMRHPIRHALGGEVPILRNPIHFSETPMEDYRSPPTLGQHTFEVLNGMLGMSRDAIEELARRHVIG